ncbi:MAG: hypothetical protein ACREA4_10385 [Nitrososphaera sp.]
MSEGLGKQALSTDLEYRMQWIRTNNLSVTDAEEWTMRKHRSSRKATALCIGIADWRSRSDKARVRSIRITENAYQAAKQIAKGMRVNGYKPDVSLVASALMVHGSRDESEEVVRKFVCELFAVEGQGKRKQE